MSVNSKADAKKSSSVHEANTSLVACLAAFKAPLSSSPATVAAAASDDDEEADGSDTEVRVMVIIIAAAAVDAWIERVFILLLVVCCT